MGFNSGFKGLNSAYHILQEGHNFGKNVKKWIYSKSLKVVKRLKPLEKFHTYNISQTEKQIIYTLPHQFHFRSLTSLEYTR